MSSNKRNAFISSIGFVGMLIISLVAIIESETGNIGSLISAIPVCILFASLFIAGYVSLDKNK
jgi:hypothetical protein